MSLKRLYYNGTEYTILSTNLYPYEIILPGNYFVTYSSFTGNIDFKTRTDIYLEEINDEKEFTGDMMVHRIGDFKIFGKEINIDEFNEEEYMKLIDSSIMITLHFNKNKYIEKISIYYLIDQYTCVEFIINPDDKYIGKDFLHRKEKENAN